MATLAFIPWAALAGGALIGLAAVLLLGLNGRIAGVSGIVGGLWFSPRSERSWRLLFALGLVAGAGLWAARTGTAAPVLPRAPWLLLLAGLLVGYGTALARGCTSGHGVCGLARWSPRSAAATATFLVVAIASTYVVRHGFFGA